MNAAYEQYERISGLTMQYVPEQTAGGNDSGFEGDLRIGGEVFNGGALADNTYPNGGDMRINLITDGNGIPSTYFTETILLQNLISHESGHGVGLGHNTSITGAESIMETYIQGHFLGLQFDDIYAFNRNYGDPGEKLAGNDTFSTGTNLGLFSTHGSTSLGTDAGDAAVDVFDDDWLGIDGDTDEDWFRFSVPQAAVVDIHVTPQGPTYTTNSQGVFNAAAQSNLRFEVYDTNNALIKSANKLGLGEAEQTNSLALLDAGEYYVRVLGDEDKNQFYQIDLDIDLPELKMIANRETGDVYLSGLTTEGVDIDGYTISSPNGGLNTAPGAWNSLASEGEPGWVETNQTNQTFIELQPSGETHIDSSDSIYLGNFFDRVVTAPFGTPHDDEDLSFSYTGEGLGKPEISGLIEFVGESIVNNLVLSVNPSTGEATLTNESQTTIDLDGYIIESASGALTPSSWLSLDEQELEEWRESNPTANAITELEPNDGTELLPFESLFLGELFDPNGLQDLTFTFLLADLPVNWEGEDPILWEGIVDYEYSADFDGDGDVDGDDLTGSYLGWQNRFGGDLNGNDFLNWQRQFGSGTTSISLSQAVPEPSAIMLLLSTFLAVGVPRKTRR